MNRPAPELLAPAGSPAMLLAALRCGADAVYLGGGGFNARASAGNFTPGELEAAIALCKWHNAKAYFALNTLVADRDLPAALALAETAVSLGADAIIVQDLGLLRLLHERFPALPLHASTQCSVQTTGGMALLRAFGVTRAVVPRECTAAELEALLRTAPVELEVFVHGALCMSVSGQCRMSAALGGNTRSANQGTCAQPCRTCGACGELGGCAAVAAGSLQNFDGLAADAAQHVLSLKDLSLLAECTSPPLNRVASFKIEGRQKRPEYAAAAVTAFRCALDGTPPAVRAAELRQAFSRSGFTQGYYHGKRDATMFGTRQHEDAASPQLLRRLAGLYADNTSKPTGNPAIPDPPRIPLALEFTGVIGEPIRLTARALAHSVTVEGAALQPARQAPLAEEDLRRQLCKLGGTPYALGSLTITLPANAFLPLGQLSALRRAACDALSEILPPPEITENERDTVCCTPTSKSTTQASPKAAQPTSPPQVQPTSPPRVARFCSYLQVPEDLSGVSKLLLPLHTPAAVLEGWRKKCPVAVTIPAGIFGGGAQVLAQLRRAAACGVTEAMAQTPDGVALALQAGLVPLAGEGMNLYNGAALQTTALLGAREAVLSPECTTLPGFSPAFAGGAIAVGALAYGRLSLMLCRNCPAKAFAGCAACQGKGELIDRKGVHFPIRCAAEQISADEKGCAEIFNSRPLWLADHLPKLRRQPLDFWLLSFTVETPAECAATLRAYQNGAAAPAEFTRGCWKNIL